MGKEQKITREQKIIREQKEKEEERAVPAVSISLAAKQ
jgi:hypothetical protein